MQNHSPYTYSLPTPAVLKRLTTPPVDGRRIWKNQFGKTNLEVTAGLRNRQINDVYVVVGRIGHGN